MDVVIVIYIFACNVALYQQVPLNLTLGLYQGTEFVADETGIVALDEDSLVSLSVLR